MLRKWLKYHFTVKLAIFPVISGTNDKINNNYGPQMNEEDSGLCMFPDLWDNSNDLKKNQVCFNFFLFRPGCMACQNIVAMHATLKADITKEHEKLN